MRMRFPRKGRHRSALSAGPVSSDPLRHLQRYPVGWKAANRALLIAVDRVNERSLACNSTFQLANILAKLRFSHS